jgi:hypothetical protein
VYEKQEIPVSETTTLRRKTWKDEELQQAYKLAENNESAAGCALVSKRNQWKNSSSKRNISTTRF